MPVLREILCCQHQTSERDSRGRLSLVPPSSCDGRGSPALGQQVQLQVGGEGRGQGRGEREGGDQGLSSPATSSLQLSVTVFCQEYRNSLQSQVLTIREYYQMTSWDITDTAHLLTTLPFVIGSV